MKIGDKVHCTKYVERRRQGISVMDYSPFVSILDEGAPRKEVVYYDIKIRAIKDIVNSRHQIYNILLKSGFQQRRTSFHK
jgi:hypothetical protein